MKKNFCAGADLSERKKLNRSETLSFLNKLSDCFKQIENLDAITIASISGACLGGGLELAISCDFRVADYSAILGFPEVSIGIIPGAGGTQRMTRLFGISLSMKWIFTAENFSGEAAYEEGVVDYLVDEDILYNHSLKLAKKITENAPLSLKSAKSSILSSLFDEGFAIERKQYIRTLDSNDRNEGLASFKEKRPPDWKNS